MKVTLVFLVLPVHSTSASLKDRHQPLSIACVDSFPNGDGRPWPAAASEAAASFLVLRYIEESDNWSPCTSEREYAKESIFAYRSCSHLEF